MIEFELSPCEASILNTVHDYQGRMVIIAALRTFCNAERVWRVIELTGKKRHASYTLYPIILKMGERTPEQYVADVEKAVQEFDTFRRDYVRRFEEAKTAKDRERVVASFDDYFKSRY